MRDYEELVRRLRDSADWADHFAVLMGRDGDVHATIMREAADAIEELNKLRWIPVTERLPENQKDVLVCYGFVHDGVTDERRFFGVLEYFAFDVIPHWQHESTGLTVTHWMPIPQPPTECRQMVTDSNQVFGDSEQLGEPVSKPYKLEEET